MHIVFGDQHIEDIKNRTTVLELDSFRINGSDQIQRAWCVIENLNLGDLMQLDKLTELHQNLMKNYRQRNWNYCRQAIEHLLGKWNGQLDSFYLDIIQRIHRLESDAVPDDWDGVIEKTTQPV